MSNGLSSLNKWLQDTIFKPLEDKKMPVMEHLVELQVRLTRAVIITAVVFVGTFFYADMLVKWLRIPLQNMFMPSSLSWVPTDLPTVPFVFLAPAEALWQNVKVAGLFALVAVTPYILLEVWHFVVPGLHAQERRFVGPFVLLSTVAFYAGVGFSFFFVLPFALNFLVSYGVNAGFIPQISIAQYVGFALWFLMVFGLIFEVPLAITLMAKLGWVDAPFLRRYRKWALLGSFIFGLPSDRPETFETTLSVAQRADLAFAQFVMLMPFPGTVDFEHWEKMMEQDQTRIAGIPVTRHWLIPRELRPKIYSPHPVMSAEEIRQRTQMVWDKFYNLKSIWRRSHCVKSIKSRLAFLLISKLYRQMYANTGIAIDSARVTRSVRWARWLAKPCRMLFVARPMLNSRSG